ncbi:RidA family protein [Eilatimonas milleporae]|uniref:Enamine deaminase RidA (YjgF/YER057c/UK114 family) n=1 Tax=Eilatimonas milleporae TaxID=911205 RepID=A0A3M0C7Y8_9PROT|nr:RidA family protein [Eilatimonas milleporae]RMB04480.1 enamine deaminase RidA (YjgF/YER057c/UK114 family) [Eilatimonas milleporae]
MSVATRLTQMGLEIPMPVAPVANYVPFVQSGNLISISGQIPMGADGLDYQGKVGDDVSVEEARAAARLCALNIIAQLNAATGGNLERVNRIVKLGGFVNCVDGFTEQPQVINAASDLMVDIFGENGRHSRSAVGVNALPLGVPVEIDALVEID